MLEINQGELNNILYQPLLQENFLDYPPTQVNENVIPVESSLTQLPTKLNRNIAYVESGATSYPTTHQTPKTKTMILQWHRVNNANRGRLGAFKNTSTSYCFIYFRFSFITLRLGIKIL